MSEPHPGAIAGVTADEAVTALAEAARDLHDSSVSVADIEADPSIVNVWVARAAANYSAGSNP